MLVAREGGFPFRPRTTSKKKKIRQSSWMGKGKRGGREKRGEVGGERRGGVAGGGNVEAGENKVEGGKGRAGRRN